VYYYIVRNVDYISYDVVYILRVLSLWRIQKNVVLLFIYLTNYVGEFIMFILIEHYKKADNGIDTVYYQGKPVTQVTKVKLPLRFGFGSYNEPMKVLDCPISINVEDIKAIVAEGELNMSE
jgi:hypothetical protein